MALAKFREPNQAAWVGVRPGHRGAQVAIGQQASNTSVIVRTVPAGKTLFLTSLVFSSGWGAGLGTLFVRDAGDSALYTICTFQFSSAVGPPGVVFGSFNPPLEIFSAYDLVITSGAAGHISNVFIHGWEE